MRHQMLFVIGAAGLLFAFSLTSCNQKANTDNPNPNSVGQENKSDNSQASKLTIGFDKMPPVGTPAKCPVMGSEFKVKEDSEFAVYQGKTYVFCCPGCKPQFEKDPEKYIN